MTAGERIGLFRRLRSDPFGLLRRGFWKLVVGPLRYRLGHRGEYAAERYWRDRFTRHGRSLRAVGHEGLSEAENATMYAQARQVFRDTCWREGLDLPRLRVLDIGCGTGFYTELCRESGVRQYLGVDITDAFFDDLRREHPEYHFRRADVTRERIGEIFDVILMVDVLEHIVSRESLDAALHGVRASLAPGGAFLFTIPESSGKQALFYLHLWSIAEILDRLPDWRASAPISFRDGHLVVVHAPHEQVRRAAGPSA